MKLTCADTYLVYLYIAGDIDSAKRTIRKYCNPPNQGLCVTLESLDFIYTFGAESGIRVGFLNYPRFPTQPEKLRENAERLACILLEELDQRSALLVTPDKTVWISRELPNELS